MTKKQVNKQLNKVDNKKETKVIQKNNNKNKDRSSQHISHPNIFSISIFSCAQQFLSLYLGIFFSQKNNSLSFIQQSSSQFLSHFSSILMRTKSPPISLVYTYEFLSSSIQSQIQLLIIRFISQLSDISQGKSILSSLSFMNNGGFLTELRHNLTHRVMGKGILIKKAKQIIIKQLKQQYWQEMYNKLIQLYSIDINKLKSIYNQTIYQYTSSNNNNNNNNNINNNNNNKININIKINNKQIDYFTMQTQNNQKFKSIIQQINHKHQSKLTSQYMIKNNNISLYQFKSNIKQYLNNIIVNNKIKFIQQNNNNDNNNNNNSNINIIQIDNNLIQQSILCIIKQKSSYTQIKLVIILNQLIQTILNTNSSFKHITIKLLIHILTQLLTHHKQLSINIINHKAIIKKIRTVYFFKYLKEFNEIIKVLPKEYVDEKIKMFWEKKEIQIGKKIILQ